MSMSHNAQPPTEGERKWPKKITVGLAIGTIALVGCDRGANESPVSTTTSASSVPETVLEEQEITMSPQDALRRLPEAELLPTPELLAQYPTDLQGYLDAREPSAHKALETLGDNVTTIIESLQPQYVNDVPERLRIATKKADFGGIFMSVDRSKQDEVSRITLGIVGEPAVTFQLDENNRVAVIQTQPIPGTYDWGKKGLRVSGPTDTKIGKGIALANTPMTAAKVDAWAVLRANNIIQEAAAHAIDKDKLKAPS
jgi:hypothetical protein